MGHAETETNWPNMLRAARRTSPLPPQVVQRLGCVPGRAPLPAQRRDGVDAVLGEEPLPVGEQGGDLADRPADRGGLEAAGDAADVRQLP